MGQASNVLEALADYHHRWLSCLEIRSFSYHAALGISCKLIPVSSLLEQPRLDGPGCHPFRSLSESSGFPAVIVSR
jgi:hypothetical protein